MSDRVLIVTPAAVLDAVSRAVVATDPGGAILSWNQAAEGLYGWTAEEALGRDIVDLLVPEGSAGTAGDVLEQLRRGTDWSGDFWTRHKDGRSLRVAVVERAVVDDGGRVIAMVGESEDVSSQRRLETELRTSRDELRLALAAGRLGTLRWDRSTGRVALDATAEALLGLGPGGFDDTFETWAATLHAEDRDRVVTMLAHAVDTQGAYDLQYRVVWPDGSVHWLEGRGQVTIDEAGRVTGRIGCMADITERRLAEDDRTRLLSAERSTRSEAETFALRLRGLQAVTVSLIRALDARSVAEAVLTEGVPAVGGRSGSICLVAEDGVTVELVHEIGYTDDLKAQWRSFPLDGDLPASEAIRTATMVVFSGEEDRDSRFPAFRGIPMRGDLAWAVVPLIDEDGAAFGVMVVGFPERRSFTDGEQRVLAALAAQCATALRRAALFEEAREAAMAEREARLAAERSHDRLAFLAEASSVLASSALDLDTTLGRVVELAVSRLGDWCAIHLVDSRGRVRPVAVAHVDPIDAELANCLAGLVDPEVPAGIRAVVRSDRAEFHARIPDGALVRMACDQAHLARLRTIGLGSLAILPLRAQDRVVGTLSLITKGGNRMEEADVQLAEELAARAGTAIDNARLFAERSRVARSLQASLLPPSLPPIPGLELGARYAPTGEGVEVGGDFYDAFALDGGRWLLVVGDVRGKGVDAAAVTGLARHTIRSIAFFEPRPSAILAHLNRILLSAEADRIAALYSHQDPAWELTEPRFCTVAVVVVEPGADGADVVVCSGGHPLPLLSRAGGGIEAIGLPGTLLGASTEIELHDVGAHLGLGDVLVCFTDGIVERHQGRDFFDERSVADVLTAAGGSDAATLAARIEQEARDSFTDSPHDDMAVLVLRVPTR